MKDFSTEYLKVKELPSDTDPYLYTTPEVKQELLEMQGSSFSIVNSGLILAMALTAPLTTITASLQLSVKPHKHIFDNVHSKSTQLTKVNTALTLQEKRKMQLLIRAGGERKPFTAPVYQGYRGVMRGLLKQGWKAFFKGFLFRTIHQLGHYFAFYEINLLQNNRTGLSQTFSVGLQILKMWVLQLACDVSLNMFHMAENRYILQNNLPEFKVFRNGSRVLRQMFHRKQIFTAASYHIFNSFVQVFGRLPLYVSLVSSASPTSLGILYLTELLMYPFNTVFRRLTCQHAQIPGMIPIRYRGFWHALQLIHSEEGLQGLYKGLGLYHLTIILRLAIISGLSPLLMSQLNVE